MFIISQPCSLELCLYKVKRGNFGITVQKYPHTQQHIIHKAPRLYITKIYIDIERGASNVLSNCCFEIGDFLNLDNALTLYYKSSIFKRLIQM